MAARYQQFTPYEYVPVPMDMYMEAGARTQHTWDTNAQKTAKLREMYGDVDVLDPDRARVDGIIGDYQGQVEKLIESHQGNYADREVGMELDRLASKYGGHRGIRQAVANKKSYDDTVALSQEKEYSDFQRNKIGQNLQAYAAQGGIGEGEGNLYNRFFGPSFYEEQNVHDEIGKFVKNLEADGFEKIETANGYIYKRGHETLDGDKIFDSVYNRLGSDTKMMQQLRDEAAYRGVDPRQVALDYTRPYVEAMQYGKETADLKSDGTWLANRKRADEKAEYESHFSTYAKYGVPNSTLEIGSDGKIELDGKKRGLYETMAGAMAANPSANPVELVKNAATGIKNYYSDSNSKQGEKQSKEIAQLEEVVSTSFPGLKKGSEEHAKKMAEALTQLNQDRVSEVNTFTDKKRIDNETRALEGYITNAAEIIDPKLGSMSLEEWADRNLDIGSLDMSKKEHKDRMQMQVIGDMSPDNAFGPFVKQVSIGGKSVFVSLPQDERAQSDPTRANEIRAQKKAWNESAARYKQGGTHEYTDGAGNKWKTVYNIATGEVEPVSLNGEKVGLEDIQAAKSQVGR